MLLERNFILADNEKNLCVIRSYITEIKSAFLLEKHVLQHNNE